ncbi:MAG: hypothetical protein NTV70_21870 [Acidobacteria bacterium]|nr:hypothetical protein [Acidobacteriota bacterium]
MQITVLEMEKARRGVERQAALRRMVEIDERMAEIAQERSALLGKLSERGSLALATEGAPEVALAAAGTGFRIRY